jgi:hypothetical protein
VLGPSLAVSSQSNRFTRLRWITPRATANTRVETQVDAPGEVPKEITRSWARLARFAAGAGGALVVLAAVSWPLVFSSATFNNDWLNHLWYMWHQSVAIREDHAPSLFLDYSGGILYPLYAFYGGTLYALVGTLSLVLGDDPLRTYVLSYLLGFAAAYGGWYWIARMFGVRGWLAQMPGLVFITSASYLTTIYALGDWPEFLAASMMPLMIAAGLSVLRAPRLRLGPALALAGSAVVFFGSHLLTMIWGSSVLAVVIVALLVGVPSVRRGVTRAGVLRVAALVIPAALVSAWFLLPTVAYEAHTLVAHAYPHARALLSELMYTVAARNLFTFSRAPASGTIVSLALPILAVAWVLVSIAMLVWRRQGGTWMRVLLIIVTATIGLTVVMTHAGLILALPRAYATLQFSFRLESFVLLGVCGAMVAVLVIAQHGDPRLRRWTWLLAPVAIVAVVGAVQQTSDHPHGKDRSTALSFLTPPPERFGQFDYVDNRLPEYDQPLAEVYFPLSTITSGRASRVVRVPPDRLVASNIRSGPDLVSVKGARIVGLNAQIDDVLEFPQTSGSDGAAPSHAPPPSATISVAPAEPLPVVAGRAISLIALAILAVEIGLLAIRGIHGYSSRRGSRQ